MTTMHWTVFIVWMLLACTWMPCSQGTSDHSYHNDVVYKWQEIMNHDDSNKDRLHKDISRLRTREQRLSTLFTRSLADLPTVFESHVKALRPGAQPKTPLRPPHPLRTPEWTLAVHWKDRRLAHRVATRVQVTFADNGYVRVVTDPDGTPTIGTWTMQPSGMAIAWQQTVDGMPCELYASFHPNVFQERPKLMQGVILQGASHRQWFRRVLGTFEGQGIGVDTISYSYRHGVDGEHDKS
jgi:hypothetical protein